jgi:hypothetical protein
MLRLASLNKLKMEIVGAKTGRERLTIVAGELWFRIERVYMARAAFHEEKDDTLGFGREVRALGRERILGGYDAGRVAVLAQEIRQAEPAETKARLQQELTSRVHNLPPFTIHAEALQST